MRTWMTRGVTAAVAIASLSSRTVHAQSKGSAIDVCVKASDDGQVARDEGRLVRARAAFRTCATASCPAIVQSNCARWLESVEAGLPTIVLAARTSNDGALTGDTAVEIDGTHTLDRLTGTPLPVDPGKHVFTFRHDGAVVVVETVVNVGEKNRLIVGLFEGAAAGTKPRVAATAETPPPTAGGKRPASLIPPLVLGAVGLVGITVFAVVGASALSDLHALESSPCATSGTCDGGEVRSVRTRFLVADLALGGGIAAIGAGALVLWLTPDTTVQVGSQPASAVRFSARF